MIIKSLRSKPSLTSLVALSVFLPVSACDLSNNYTKIDRTTHSEFQDYRDALAPREAEMAGGESADVPALESYVSEDTVTSKPMPLVSLSINQSIPLREALFELAKQGDYDVELDPRISGSIIFTARNKPFDVVIDRVCEIAGLRYKLDDTTLRIELDTPYTQTYKVDYLSFVRNSASNIKTDVSVASTGGIGGGSNFAVDSKATSDFWAELDANIKQILESNSSPSYLKTDQDPQLSITSANPVVPPVPPVDAASVGDISPEAGDVIHSDFISSPQMVKEEDIKDTESSSMDDGSSVSTGGSPTVAGQVTPPAQQPVLKVESLPTSLAGSDNAKQNDVQFTPAYSINKQAGIISVYANERVQRKIADYLEDLRKATTSQVLIEAKVLEVSLSDEFAAGIDWSFLDHIGDVALSGGEFALPALDPAASGSGITFRYTGADLGLNVQALSRFGTVHALASPRLTVINNQAAVLNVAKNQVYFELDVSSDSTSDGTSNTTTTTVDSTIKTVPEGVLINVMPSINLDKRTISMQVRPTVTKIVDYAADPGVAYIVATADSADLDGLESNIPIVNVQEVDSILNMKSGQMVVMGGLLQDSTRSSQEGVPVASEVPVLGGLFRNQGDKVTKTELVIFIKATILDDASQSIHQTDRDLYRTFSQDRRPVRF